MKHSKFLLAIILLFGGFSLFAQENPVAWTLKIDTPNKSFKAGDTFNVQISAHIQPGWHLYSLTKLENGPIATSINLEEGQPFEQVGGVKSPDPIVTFDPNFNLDTEYYEKSATFSLTVKVLPGISPNNKKLTVQTRYQSCNSEMCLPPKLEKHELLIEVSSAPQSVAPKAVGVSQVKAVGQTTSNKNSVTDFAFTDFKGKKRKLSDFRGKQNVILVFYRGFF